MSIKNSILYVLLYLLPKNCVSALMGRLVSIRLPRALAVTVNKLFARAFRIPVEEAEKPIHEYPCLQDFFVRRLKSGLRPIAEGDVMISPCDGFLSVAAEITNDSLIQAKGKNYSLTDLFQHEELARKFSGGQYATIYLSPKDYHRFHVPLHGVIERTYYIPGNLWPVNRWAVDNVENLFCQNERVISLIRHANNKIMAHIAVGATMVGKIDLSYLKLDYTMPKNGQAYLIEHEPKPVVLGQELGKFMFGSTIILVMEQGLLVDAGTKNFGNVKMGELLGRLR